MASRARSPLWLLDKKPAAFAKLRTVRAHAARRAQSLLDSWTVSHIAMVAFVIEQPTLRLKPTRKSSKQS